MDTRTLHEDQLTFLIISRSILLRIENILDKNYRENRSSIFFFFFRKYAVYEITRKNMVEPNTPQMAIWRMCIVCCITKATDTHSEYVIRIIFPLLQWLRERASFLSCTYFVWLCCIIVELVIFIRFFNEIAKL